MLGFYDDCITKQGFTGEVCFSDNVGFEWGLEYVSAALYNTII